MSFHYSEEVDDSGDLPRHLAQPSRRGGWQGEEMELAHRPSAEIASHAAVDLNQFRNTQIGQGYQAKHVVRQRSAHEKSTLAVKEMVIEKNSSKEKKSKKRSAENDTSEKNNKSQLQTYLQCEGLRKFRKELDSIESSI